MGIVSLEFTVVHKHADIATSVRSMNNTFREMVTKDNNNIINLATTYTVKSMAGHRYSITTIKIRKDLAEYVHGKQAFHF